MKKLREVKLSFSNALIGLVGIFILVCILSTIYFDLIQKTTFSSAVISAISWTMGTIWLVVLPLSAIVIFVSQFLPREKQRFDYKTAAAHARLVIEHIQNLNEPIELEHRFVPKIEQILRALENPNFNFITLRKLALEIADEVNSDSDFEESWLGQELYYLVYLVENLLKERLRVN
jgi:ABC-type bacteriocin/lantibiotic exporter with double-glycine peptidase domain